MTRLIIPTGMWKVRTESSNEQATIRLSGLAFSDFEKMEQRTQTILLTPDQAHELVSGLDYALCQLDRQRRAEPPRVVEAEGEGEASEWDYFLSGA